MKIVDVLNKEEYLIKDDIRLDHFFEPFIANNYGPKSDDQLALDIESDKQYRENDIYYAVFAWINFSNLFF